MTRSALRRKTYTALSGGEAHRGTLWLALLITFSVIFTAAITVLQSVPSLRPAIAAS